MTNPPETLGFDPGPIATVDDLLSVEVKEWGESLWVISPDVIHTEYRAPLDELKALCGNTICARADVVYRLEQAQRFLELENPDLQIVVTYGYRPDYLQCKYFIQRLGMVREVNPKITLKQGIDLAHDYAAFPPVAGHPTGGCIDATIRNRRTGKELDMGAPVYCPSPLCYARYPYIPPKARANREFLRWILECYGFYAFNGEFWHFSFGDREWAFHNNTSAIYGPLPSEALSSAQVYIP